MKETLTNRIKEGARDMCYIWAKEMRSTITDEGVLIFFILVPILYPLLYSWAYSGEVVREVPVAVVDLSHSHQSRQFIREFDASPDVKVAYYCQSLDEGKQLVGKQVVHGVLYFPEDFQSKTNRLEQSHVGVYCDMSLMLTYKAIYQSAQAIATNMNTGIQIALSGNYTDRENAIQAAPLAFEEVPLFNSTGGYGSFLIPCVLILIIQQTLLLGIGLAAGTARESNRYRDLVPVSRHYNGIFRIVLGKSLAYLMIYAIIAAYLTLFIPKLFGFTSLLRTSSGMLSLSLFMLPYLLSCIFFGMMLSCLVRYRENVLLLVVFTSIPFLFLAGISWPESSMPGVWKSIATLIPSTFGVRGFVRMNTMGASLSDVQVEYQALWLQTAVYFLMTCAVYRFQIISAHRHANDQILILRQIASEAIKRKTALCLLLACSVTLQAKQEQQPTWPDGTPMEAWFCDTTHICPDDLGCQYMVTDYGVTANDSMRVQTQQIQHVIDLAAQKGGGVVVMPKGIYLSGALHFRQGTHLWLQEGARLKGSDRIADFPVCMTRIEGESCRYFPALINADGLDGFTILGPGTIDGNGRHYWKEFWIRREWNPQCTNKDAQRPRLVFISNSRNVTVQGVHTINSPFWTNHLYRCERVRYIDCFIYAPTGGVFDFAGKEHGAPSSDAIDIDVCHDVVVRGCYMNVCDDAVVLKGGKGTWADRQPENGPCERILIEQCRYGKVHGCLTLGSESLHDRNVILRQCHAENANRVLWLKMRPDTPQHYEYVNVENMTGKTGSFLVVRPWTQFFKPGDREDMPLSQCDNITMKNITMQCRNFFDVGTSDKYHLSNFTFENIDVSDERQAFDPVLIPNTTLKNVRINGTSF